MEEQSVNTQQNHLLENHLLILQNDIERWKNEKSVSDKEKFFDISKEIESWISEHRRIIKIFGENNGGKNE